MQRKLTAILSADVVGYSGLMEADEAGTLARLKLNRSTIFDPNVTAHRGRVFKLMGDGALAEFPSVVEAVNCALAIQDAMAHVEPDMPLEGRIQYRIGINLGDIIVEGDDIYGDGVNIASRLQSLAPVGGVALSGVVRDQVEGKTPCVFEDMGEHTVKKLERPIRVFSVRAAESSHKTRPAEVRPHAICVLPFANISDDPQQDYFSDGISEDITTDLSKMSALRVIARNTSFQFKGKNVDATQIARQLKVRHILEGSVRRAGGRVRITAQLIDGASGDHVWAERYDRDLNDIFAVQDEISEAIVKALKLKLLPEERKAIEQRGTGNPEAYKLYLLARSYYATGIGRHRDLIIRLCKRAIEIDPRYGEAWGLLAICEADVRFLQGAPEPSGWEAAERAIALNPNVAEAHSAKGRILAGQGRFEEAGREHELALQLAPDSYEVNCSAARWLWLVRDFPRVIKVLEKATTMVETDYWAAGAFVFNNAYEAVGDGVGAERAARRALERVEKVLATEPAHAPAMAFGVISLIKLGQRERAMEWINHALLIDPDSYQVGSNIAVALAALGETDRALDIVEKHLPHLPRELLLMGMRLTSLDQIRDNPRSKAIQAKVQARLAEATPSPEV
jgi:adenylate cyclase